MCIHACIDAGNGFKLMVHKMLHLQCILQWRKRNNLNPSLALIYASASVCSFTDIKQLLITHSNRRVMNFIFFFFNSSTHFFTVKTLLWECNLILVCNLVLFFSYFCLFQVEYLLLFLFIYLLKRKSTPLYARKNRSQSRK